jgi:hypothetical protein
MKFKRVETYYYLGFKKLMNNNEDDYDIKILIFCYKWLNYIVFLFYFKLKMFLFFNCIYLLLFYIYKNFKYFTIFKKVNKIVKNLDFLKIIKKLVLIKFINNISFILQRLINYGTKTIKRFKLIF